MLSTLHPHPLAPMLHTQKCYWVMLLRWLPFQAAFKSSILVGLRVAPGGQPRAVLLVYFQVLCVAEGIAGAYAGQDTLMCRQVRILLQFLAVEDNCLP